MRTRTQQQFASLAQSAYDPDAYDDNGLVQDNELSRNPSGMQLHNGFRNRIEGNRFDDSRREHILFNETAGFAAIEANRVTGNRFSGAAAVPVFRLWSRHGGANVARFAEFSDNRYKSLPKQFAEVEGNGMLDFERWRERIAGDGDARASGSSSAGRTSPQLTREREKE